MERSADMEDLENHPHLDPERLRGQQIIREVVRERAPEGNGSFNKFKDGALLLAVGGLVAVVWTMNTRLTRMEMIIEFMATAMGVEVPK